MGTVLSLIVQHKDNKYSVFQDINGSLGFPNRLQLAALVAGCIRQSNCGSALSDANHQLEGLEKHQKSSGLLASLMVTLFTVWV
jgi:hypothetical protein